MVITNERLIKAQNNSASDMYDDVSDVVFGDDDTTPEITNTNLGNETYEDPIFKKSLLNNVVNVDARLDVTENNDNFIKEIGIKNSDGNLETRNLTNSFEKTNTKEAYFRIKNTFTFEDDS